jgi:hypothetical protein
MLGLAKARSMPYRLGPSRYVSRGGCMAKIGEDARRNVVFLGHDDSKAGDPSGIAVVGTGFLVYCGEGSYHGVYLVTCGYIADFLADNPFVIRVNDEAGQARLDHVDMAVWHYHSDYPAVDLAIMRYEPPEWSSGIVLPVSEFLTPERARIWDIGPGGAAYLVGLFYLHMGKHRNLPVIHAGQIALMPSDEKIPVTNKKTGKPDEVEAYLVEIQGLKGASGSPVMVRPTLRHHIHELNKPAGTFDVDESIALSEGRDYFLGMWIAAWPGTADKYLGDARGIPDSRWVPVGMGLVLPCDRIMDVLNYETVIGERQGAMAKYRASMAAVPTGLGAEKRAPETKPDENPAHREDFTALLGEAAKPKPKGGQT